MARAGAGGLNVGRAALLIVTGLVIGVFVLNQGDDTPSAASFDRSTVTTIDITDLTSPPTTVRKAATATTLGLRAPASFTSVAINATNTGGVGAKATAKLQAAGYNAIAPGDATAAAKKDTKASAILFAPGFEREAAAVATLFQLPQTAVRALTSPPPSTAVKNASIVVLVGPDIKL